MDKEVCKRAALEWRDESIDWDTLKVPVNLAEGEKESERTSSSSDEDSDTEQESEKVNETEEETFEGQGDVVIPKTGDDLAKKAPTTRKRSKSGARGGASPAKKGFKY